MGRVFLGRPGPWADENRETSDHYTAKIGGLPDWPSPLMDWGSDFLKCSICGNKLCLVGQVSIFSVIGNLKVEERVLYIYGCIAPECGSSPLSWQAIHIQRSCEEKEPNSTCCDVGIAATPSVSAGKNDCWNDLDEKDEDVDLEELGQALAEAATPYLKDATSACMNYSSLSINVDNHVREEVLDEESYEYDRALMADRTYFKFKKRLDAYPEQCLRYSNGGKPLLATKEIGDPGRCKLCGGPRQFEMQLMLPLLYFLHEAVDDAQKDALENWNWMTAIKYTCSKEFRGGDWIVAEEAVLVQCEKSLKQAVLDYISHYTAVPSCGPFSHGVNSRCPD
ncbi:hypothetical protein EUGRSUZ_H04856 [Eucalyptus grandis]|uniref:Uncharacterized protein n=2 Tax=Eucalyptus grandis TaxID=71139 RepID=A0ACC3JYE6_EUCGR|nr:hypothetical protein EUGRSUZ_H04856 [Eucalyptus grandis]